MARIVKGTGDAKVTPGAVVDARAEAQRLIREAEKKATRIVADAEATADAIREQARREGRHEALQRAQAILQEAEATRLRALDDAKESMVKLAVAVASKLLREELESRPEQVNAILEEQLGRIRRAQTIKARLCERDVDRARAIVDERVILIADATLGPGEVILESELGEIDATLETRLRVLRQVLLDELR